VKLQHNMLTKEDQRLPISSAQNRHSTADVTNSHTTLYLPSIDNTFMSQSLNPQGRDRQLFPLLFTEAYSPK